MTPGVRGFLLFIGLCLIGLTITRASGPCMAWFVGALIISWLSVPAWKAIQRANEASASPTQESGDSSPASGANTHRKA
jgi:hypothetical protein